MRERRGAAWYGDRLVGRLREDERRTLRFAYAAEWLDGGGFPVSVRLPLSVGDREVDAHSFFEGLLPEGAARQRIARQLGIDSRDDAALLFAIGEDCAGALSVLPEGREPADESAPPRPLSPDALAGLIRSRGSEPAGDRAGQRFSLAGAQEKRPVIDNGTSFALPDRLNPSSHILKFETLPWVCFAEFTAHDMARRAGLPVAGTDYRVSGTGDDATPYLRVERFDRARTPTGTLERLHQEDLVQALGGVSMLKYQQDGGPSPADVAGVLREHTARPLEALSHLRDWQILNCLIGNWDGHGKNLALLYKPGEPVPSLAPFYDLVAIEFLNLVKPGSWARDMAFAVGEHYIPEKIGRSDWEAFARDLGMPPKRVLSRVEELAGLLPGIATEVRDAFAEQHGDEAIYNRLVESVRRRCKWTLQSIGTSRQS